MIGMEEKRKIPELRFPGFTDDWEKRKLGECCEQLTATIDPQQTPNKIFKEYSMPAYDFQKIPAVVAGLTMNSSRKVIDRSCLLINKLNVRKKRIWKVENPGNNAVCSAEFVPVYSDKADLSFLQYVVSSDKFTNYLEACSSGTSNSQKRVTPEAIMEARIMVPLKGEQHKIGAFFGTLDKAITLHQRKENLLRELKKGMLQKIFSQEFRFKDDNGQVFPKWKVIKLESISTLITVGIANSATQAYCTEGTVMLRNLNIKPNQLDDSEIIHIDGDFEKKYKNKRLRENDILIVRTGYPGTACLVPKKYENAQTFTTLIVRLDQEIAFPAYVCQFINSYDGRKFIESVKIGGGQQNIGANIISEMMIKLPCLREQKIIANYFTHLDSLITAEQKKVSTLQTMKKGFLQKMFV